ncbi:MAG: phenylacetate-CoA oxygenase subunit PaaI, partial [Bacteroidota bacterium]|nr:phenylacetate-CoA oxygenase subunit PaaI [Bacteroidota bacterium]
ISRLQASLDYALPYALGIFEESPFEKVLQDENIFGGEKIAEQRWKSKVEEILRHTKLILPEWRNITPVNGGRSGRHSEHLQPLLDEMSEVFRIDPQAEW